MNNELPSYFRRGQGVVNNHRQSPLAPFPGLQAPKPCDRAAEGTCVRHRCFLAMPTGKGFKQVSLNKS